MPLKTTTAIAFLAAATLTAATAAAADPSIFNNGYGNAQDTVNALKALGYNVVINGATVYPLTSCRTTGVEGLRETNSNANGTRNDPAEFDTVYVDVACKGG